MLRRDSEPKVSKIESVIDDEPDTKRLLLWDLLGNSALTIRASSEVVEAWKKAADSAACFRQECEFLQCEARPPVGTPGREDLQTDIRGRYVYVSWLGRCLLLAVPWPHWISVDPRFPFGPKP